MPSPELLANAARSNLTRLRPDDRVWVAHQRLPIGRLWPAVVDEVVNASVRFDPPIPAELLLVDPEHPAAGTLNLPAAVNQASARFVFREPAQPSAPSPQPPRSKPVVAEFEPLDDAGLESFLVGLEDQLQLIDMVPSAAA